MYVCIHEQRGSEVQLRAAATRAWGQASLGQGTPLRIERRTMECLYTYIYIYVNVCIQIYIYIYIYLYLSLSLYIYIYIYIFLVRCPADRHPEGVPEKSAVIERAALGLEAARRHLWYRDIAARVFSSIIIIINSSSSSSSSSNSSSCSSIISSSCSSINIIIIIISIISIISIITTIICIISLGLGRICDEGQRVGVNERRIMMPKSVRIITTTITMILILIIHMMIIMIIMLLIILRSGDIAAHLPPHLRRI